MRRLHLFVALVLALAPAPALAQQAELMSDWGEEDMRAVLTGSGVKVGEPTFGPFALPATSAGGLSFGVYGAECTGEGRAQRCRGAEFLADFNLGSDARVQSALRGLDYAAVAYFNGGNGRLRVTRYIIFDHGIARANLKTNAQIFVSLAEQIRAKLAESD